MTSSFKEAYDQEGYVIVPALLSPDEIDTLRNASERVINKTREGEWPHRRIVGKQFPPFDTNDERPDVWGVQHVMHPGLKEPTFVKWYGSEPLIRVIAELMDCKEEDLQMELFNLLINPSSHNFALRWHRDDVREDASEEEEKESLSVPHYGIQWNTALYNDDCLYVVPRSHLTARTPAQRKLSSTQTAPEDPLVMPDAIQVHLKAGETVFYNNNILHTARYRPEQKRATLHACAGNTHGGSKRARNILQHGLSWMRDPALVATFGTGADGERLKGMWDRLLLMERSVEERGNAVGYSQIG